MAIFPSARIYIQVQETREVIFMDTFVSVDTDLELDGGSSATIRLMNRDDQWYSFAGQDIKKQTDITQFLLQAYQSNLYQECNAKRQDLVNQALKAGTDAAWQKVYSMQQFLMFNLFCRVWIDFRGRKDLIGLENSDSRKFSDKPDRWYAGFTGIITSIDETNDQGKDKSVIISCRDMMRFFETTLVTTSPGFDPQMTLDTDVNIWASAYFNVNFASFVDGGNIIRSVTDLVNKNFHRSDGLSAFPFSKFWNLPNTKLSTGQAADIITPSYLGISNRRAPTGLGALPTRPGSTITSDRATPVFQQIKSRQILQNEKKADIIQFIGSRTVNEEYVEDPSTIRDGFNPDRFTNAISGTVDGKDTYQGNTYSMDTMIANDVSSGAVNNPYQQIIKEAFTWETTRVSASDILKQVAGVTGYHTYCDAKGNLIYQKCRYDDFPNTDPESNYDLVSDSVGIPMIDELGQYKNPSQNPNLDKYAMRFHGRNYLIGDESLESWSFHQDEGAIMTHVIVPPVPQNFDLDEHLTKFFSGVGVASPDITNRFGVRILHAQQMVVKGLNKFLTQMLAEGYVRKINASIDQCTVKLDCRPDLQIGRTMYLMERRKLYYITGIQNHLTWGDKLETTVSGAYGHNPFSPILDPWRIAFTGTIDTSNDQFKKDLNNRQILQDYFKQSLLSTNAP